MMDGENGKRDVWSSTFLSSQNRSNLYGAICQCPQANQKHVFLLVYLIFLKLLEPLFEICSIFVQVIHHRPEISKGQLDFGTLAMGEKRTMNFTLRNDNPVDVRFN